MMNRYKFATTLLLSALLAACNVPQIMVGQLYRIQTPPSDACKTLVWLFVVNPQHEIAGSLAGGNQVPFADLSGTLNQDETFVMTVTDHDTKGTATVTGQFTSQVSTISIRGDGAGPGCDGQTFSLRLGAYFARSGGGGGGGG